MKIKTIIWDRGDILERLILLVPDISDISIKSNKEAVQSLLNTWQRAIKGQLIKTKRFFEGERYDNTKFNNCLG